MIEELYEEVQGIVYKCRNEYYLHLLGAIGLGTKRELILLT